MVRTIGTAVYTVIRKIQWRKHYNSVAVKLKLNFLCKIFDFLVKLRYFARKQNRCLTVIKSITLCGFFQNTGDQLFVGFMLFGIIKCFKDFFIINEILCFTRHYIVAHVFLHIAVHKLVKAL